jgi:hypothetical protein
MPSRDPEQIALDVAERGGFIVPCPRVGAGRLRFGPLAREEEGLPPASQEPPWLALEPGVGPARLLVSWAVADALPVPRAYRIDTSGDSQDGRDGSWRRELEIDGNSSPERAHLIEFDGQGWVRLTLLDGAPPELERFDLHDASDGTDDAWLVAGDAAGLLRPPGAGVPSFAELVNERYPGYFPALLHTRAAPAAAPDLPALLQLHPHARHVLLLGDSDDARVRAVLDAGRVPLLLMQHPEREALQKRHDLIPGPDLAAWRADLAASEARASLQRLCADAFDVFYVPQ